MKKMLVLVASLITLVGVSALVYVAVLGKRNSQNILRSDPASIVKLKNDTHVFMFSDNAYAMPTCVAIASILSNSSEDEKINIHIVSFEDDQINQENVKKIEKLKTTIKDFNLDFTFFDKKRINRLKTDHWSKAILVKLFAAELFPKLDKVIWLDGDIIVLKSLNEIYKTSLDGKYLAGVDVSDEYNRHKKNTCPYWITAGFGVYNLKEIRKDNFQKDLLNFAKQYPVGGHLRKDFCGGAEEYALTQIPKCRVNVLPYNYSVMCSLFGAKAYENLNLEDCVILHYAGCKPWRDAEHINKRFLDIWKKYFNMTEYAKEIESRQKAA